VHADEKLTPFLELESTKMHVLSLLGVGSYACGQAREKGEQR
jgi:hypothetical protein